MIAAQEGHRSVLELLVSVRLGAQVNSQSNVSCLNFLNQIFVLTL